MKRLIAYFITISLLLGCVGNAKEATAQAKIQATVKDMSGVKRKLTMDSVKHVATKLIRYNYPGEYAQVADGHYYYMRQTGENNRYTVYRDKGKKVGSFKYTYESPGWGYRWNAFGWHEGKLYVKFSDEDDHMIKIGVVDFKQESIKTICTCKFPASTIDVSWMDVYLYQNKIYANYVMKVKARYIRKVKEYELSSGNLLNTFSDPGLINIADGKIYYTAYQGKGKKQIITFRCRDMATNKDKKVFRCTMPGKSYYFDELIMKGKEIYYYRTYGEYEYTSALAYSIPSFGGKMQQIGKGEIRNFVYSNKYYFYIDKKFRLHRQNRKTGKDKIISGIKAVKVDCTQKGLYVQKYDKWFDKDGFEDANDDYTPALYFMNFKGKNVKKIAKYTYGHMSYEGWW